MKEYRIVCPCTTTTPLVCRGEPTALTDADFRRDSGGRLVIPGTSIAGVLRTAVEQSTGTESRCLIYDLQRLAKSGDDVTPCQCSTCKLFGDVKPVDVPGKNNAERLASRVSVFDAVLSERDAGGQPIDGPIRIVDGVALDRGRRAASDAKKYDHLEVAAGRTFVIEIRAEGVTDTQLELLLEAVYRLGDGQLALGGRSSNGLGRLRADWDKFTVRWRDLSDANDLIACLVHPNESNDAWPREFDTNTWLTQWQKSPRPIASEAAVVQFDLKPTGHSSLLIADPQHAARTGFDRAPRGGPDEPELPVSSLRGALRSTAERILRTLKDCAKTAACDVTGGGDPCFAPDEADENHSYCLACQLFGNQRWASRLAITVERQSENAETTPLDHVAIDRFTGGAAAHRKFNALAVKACRYHVTMTLSRLRETDDREWMLGLLLLALQDLHDGRATLGSGASRGHGLVQLENVTVDGSWQAYVEALWTKLGIEKPTPTETDS